MRTRHLLPLFFAASLASAAAADWTDFTGSWDASYTDPVLNLVKGHVIVRAGRPDSPLPIEVDVTYRHPETGARTQLTATRAARNGAEITLTLRGASPSGPSAAVPRQPGSSRQMGPPGVSALWEGWNELFVPPRAMLTAKLRGTDASAQATIDDALAEPVTHELTLVGRLAPEDGQINWRWNYSHPGTPPGLRGRRLGELRDGGKTVFGDEVWTRLLRDGIVAVEQEGGFTPAPDAGHGAEVFATLIIRGWSMPVNPGDALTVAFLDPFTRFDRVLSARHGSGLTTGTPAQRQDEIRFRVRVGAGIATGPKDFTVNGAEAVWMFRLPESLPALRVLAVQPGNSLAPTTAPCVNDVIRVEVKFDQTLPFDRRLAQLRVAGQVFGPFLLSRSDGTNAAHLSLPFRLTSPGTPPAAGGPAQVYADGGDTIVLESADSLKPVEWGTFRVLPAGARTTTALVVSPEGIWTSDASLSDLVKDDRFSVMVRMPAAQAATLGETIEVELAVRGAMPTATVASRVAVPGAKLTLLRRAVRTNAPVVEYAMRQPASFGAGISRPMFFDTLEFTRSILDVKDGETVEFKYGATMVPVKVHDTALKKRLEVRRRQLTTLLTAMVSVAGDPQLSPAQRARILDRVAMLRNALVIGRAPELYGAEQVAAMEAYLYLLNEPNLTRLNAPVARYGANFVFNEEVNAVNRAIKVDAREVMRSALLGMAGDVTVGLVEFVADKSNVGGLYTAVTGRTIMGQRVDVLHRILAAADATVGIVSEFAGPRTRDDYAEKWIAEADAKRQAWRDAEKERRAAAIAANPPPLANSMTSGSELPSAKQPTVRVAEGLRSSGAGAEAANRAAESLYRRHPNLPAEIAEAGLAAEGKIAAARFMEHAGISADEYARRLDEYYRTVSGIDDPQVRARLARRAMGSLTPPGVRAAAEAADEASRIAASAPPPSRPPGTPPGPPPNKPPGVAPGTPTPDTPVTVDAPPRPPLDPTVAEYLENERLKKIHEAALQDMDLSALIARGPHTGRDRIQSLVEDEVIAARREHAILHSSPTQIAAAEHQIREEFDRLHPIVDKIENVVGNRSLDDYDAIKSELAHGCTENEALAGQFWIRNQFGQGIRPQTIMTVMGLDRAGLERSLDQYLLKSQHSTNPELRARAIHEFFGDR